ncbi:MAG: trypsin-like serine protease [Cyanobacteriota bacterium]|nr:trypsin-like serine protease [Cyanobacteriota bacterium]
MTINPKQIFFSTSLVLAAGLGFATEVNANPSEPNSNPSNASLQKMLTTLDGEDSPVPLLGSEYQKTIVGGILEGDRADSPTQRIDPNLTTSLFAGVGSITAKGFLCTGTAITRTHILTAAHCFDHNDNGSWSDDLKPNNVLFNLNFGQNRSHRIRAKQLDLHSDYTGFARPSVNDDLAIITLEEALPEEVPTYQIYRDPLVSGDVLTMVGYGYSGNGVDGYTTRANITKKRIGQNSADRFWRDDEGKGHNEVFLYDFDGPDSSSNRMGGTTLGNEVEGIVGPGDSGGPSFIWDDETLLLAGINTFTFGGGGKFGSTGGGMIVSAYADWIESIAPIAPPNLETRQAPEKVPEPGTFAGLTVAVLGLLRKRK